MAEVVWMVFHPSMAILSDPEDGVARVVRRPVRSGRGRDSHPRGDATVIDFAQAAARRSKDPSPAWAGSEGVGEAEASDAGDANLSSLSRPPRL